MACFDPYAVVRTLFDLFFNNSLFKSSSVPQAYQSYLFSFFQSVVELARKAQITVSTEFINREGIVFSRDKLVDGNSDAKSSTDFIKYCFHSKHEVRFLVACMRLYRSLCQSVGWLVCRFVCLSVCPTLLFLHF